MFAIVGMQGFSLRRAATLSLAFKLLPGRLPARTPKFEFQMRQRGAGEKTICAMHIAARTHL